jgi:hypothetical protein
MIIGFAIYHDLDICVDFCIRTEVYKSSIPSMRSSEK